LASVIMTVIESESVLESESTTDAVIVCMPTESEEFVNELPEPIIPSIDDFHAIESDNPPSSGSVAEPENSIAVPLVKLESSAGAVIETSGVPASFIVIVIESESVLESESTTDAVIVCMPTESEEFVNELPEPIIPSIDDFHAIESDNPPSSGSVAEPENSIAVPLVKLESSAGAVIETSGVPASFIVIVIESESVLESESTTDAVIVCMPTESEEFVNELPEPIIPSIDDFHAIESDNPPSSGSVALPENVTNSPSTKLAPLSGEVIVTAGEEFTPTSRKSDGNTTIRSFPVSAT